MQKSLVISYCKEINSPPYWKIMYSSADGNGNGRSCEMSVQMETATANSIESLITLVSSYVPGAAPDALSQAKAVKLNELDSSFNNILKQGWESGEGRLGMTAEDVALLSGAFALAKEASSLGLPLPSLISLQNTLISFENIQQFTQMMLQYGAARSAISTQYANLRKAVQDATSLEEVYNVSPV